VGPWVSARPLIVLVVVVESDSGNYIVNLAVNYLLFLPRVAM